MKKMIGKKIIEKGLSLVEVLLSVSILSILIGVMAYIMILYNKLNREVGFLTASTLDAKEVGVKIEKYMIISPFIKVNKISDNNIKIECLDVDIGGTLGASIADIYYIKNANSTYIKIQDNLINTTIEKNLSKEIYMVVNEYRNYPKVIEVSFYVYNTYAKKYRNLEKKTLAYYISLIKYHH